MDKEKAPTRYYTKTTVEALQVDPEYKKEE